MEFEYLFIVVAAAAAVLLFIDVWLIFNLIMFTNVKFPAEQLFTDFCVVSTEINIQNTSSTPQSSLGLLPFYISQKAATILICITTSFSCSQLHKNGIKECIFFMCGSSLTTLCLWDSFMCCHFVKVVHFFVCSSTLYKYITIYPF